MRILVTGASGLLGLNVALEAAKEHHVFGLVNSHTLAVNHTATVEYPAKNSAGAGFHPGTFQARQANLLVEGTLERLLDDIQPDWVIHCAALADLEACETDPARARELNTEVPRKLAALVARGGARLLHVSTDAVFNGARPMPGLSTDGGYVEGDAPDPLSTYARTKLAGEYAVAGANPEALVARVNLFGWSLGGRRSLAEWFFNNLAAGRATPGFTDIYFCPLLANDMAGIFLEMLVRGLSGLYHVFSGDTMSKYAFGVALAQHFQFDERLVRPSSAAAAGLKAARSPYLIMNTGKLASALGRPQPTIAAGLEGFVRLYQQGYPQQLRYLAGGE